MDYGQISLFELITKKKIITKPIRLIELFAGYGSQNLALKYLDANYEHYKICEWATKSIQAYNDLHIQDYNDYSRYFTQEKIIEKLYNYGISVDYNQPMTKEQIKRKGEKWQRQTYNNIVATNNLVNIQNVKADDLKIVETDKYEYIITYSFPCQDLSLAGKSKGMSKGSGTRSGMLWEVERILEELKEKPQILLMENVPLVIGQKNIKDFQNWVMKLEQLGYSNFVDVINAKDFGIPQNRERCFMISILGEYSYKFPKPIKLENRLKDLLETDVDESYFLSDKMINCFTSENSKNFNRKERFLQSLEMTNLKGIATTINTTAGNRPVDNFVLNDKVNRLYGLFDTEKTKHQAGSVYDVNGLAPTLDTMNGGYREPCIEIREATKKGFAIAQDVVKKLKEIKIRKLTPNECFRLMGVKDEDFEKVKQNQSNSSLYHLAGDSIVTTCLMALFGELLNIDYLKKIKDLIDEIKEEKYED